MQKKTQQRTGLKQPEQPRRQRNEPAAPAFFEDAVLLDLSLKVYPLEAVYSAAYVFTERCWLLLDQERAGRVLVQLKPKSPHEDKEDLAADFSAELLRQALRLKIAKRTAPVREMLVGRALLAAEPLTLEPGPLETDDDYLADPLGIAVPWEERFGQNAPAEDRSDPRPDSNRQPEGSGS